MHSHRVIFLDPEIYLIALKIDSALPKMSASGMPVDNKFPGATIEIRDVYLVSREISEVERTKETHDWKKEITKN